MDGRGIGADLRCAFVHVVLGDESLFVLFSLPDHLEIVYKTGSLDARLTWDVRYVR